MGQGGPPLITRSDGWVSDGWLGGWVNEAVGQRMGGSGCMAIGMGRNEQSDRGTKSDAYPNVKL